MNIDNLFPTKYIKPVDLQGKDVTLTIKRASLEMMGQGVEKEQKLVIWFERTEKGLIMNRTNATVITNLHGKETDDWIGKRIIIYATSVTAFGKKHDVIRIRERVPAAPIPRSQATPAAPPPPPEPELDDPEDYLDHGDGDDETVAQGTLMDEPVRNPFTDGIPYWKAALVGLPSDANDLIGFSTSLHRNSEGESTLADYKQLKGLILQLCAGTRTMASEVLSILCQTEINESNRTGVTLTAALLRYISPTVADDTGAQVKNLEYNPKMAQAIKTIAQNHQVKEPA